MATELWTAYWTMAPRHGVLRTEAARAPGPGEALVRTICSGISHGTEMLVHAGRIPPEVAESMRAPFQVGSWPGPVKYGYLSVGVVEQGPTSLKGSRVFCLHPHQDRYVVPASALTPVPDDVPSDRAVLAGTVETGINALWDAGPRIGDRVAVVGAGMVGGVLAALLRTFPLDRLQLVDVNPARSSLAAAWVSSWYIPMMPLATMILFFIARPPRSGLARSLQLLGDEAELIELSWYGTRSRRCPGWRVPFPAAGDPGQPGWRRRGRPAASANHERPAGACHANARGSGLRRVHHWPRTVCSVASDYGVDLQRWDRDTVPGDRLPGRRGGLILFHLTVRDHVMIAHSLRTRRSAPLRTCTVPRTSSS